MFFFLIRIQSRFFRAVFYSAGNEVIQFVSILLCETFQIYNQSECVRQIEIHLSVGYSFFHPRCSLPHAFSRLKVDLTSIFFAAQICLVTLRYVQE